MRQRHWIFCCLISLCCAPEVDAQQSPSLHWPLDGALHSVAGSVKEITNHGVTFTPGERGKKFATFDGRGAHLEVPFHAELNLGKEDFTIVVRIETTESLDDDLGDLLSQFDPNSRTGFHLGLRNNSGVTHSQTNYRQLQFGLDAGSDPIFVDEGRPGTAIYGQSMAVHDDQLYVGTCEAGADRNGHVFQYEGTGHWKDLGSPDKSNSITAMAAYRGALYVGSGKYRLGGSALQESENPNLGGRVYRYLGDSKWTQVGHFPEMESVGGMVVYRGRLYVSSLYKPAAFYRYEEDDRWTPLPVPNGKRVEALGVFDQYLWASGYDEGNVYRFDGENWSDLGRVGDETNTQTYAFATYQGRLRVATWRSGKVFELNHGVWQDLGQLGDELEVMGMLTHNGSFYGGTLPLGQLYRWDGGQKWTLMKQLDTTPDVKYRRVWAMAQFQGKLFATTLPSGHVWSMDTGACVTWDRELPPGWHQIAAQREGNVLRLFVDGELVAEKTSRSKTPIDLAGERPWKIGAGSGDYFHGKMSELRIYRKAISVKEIRELARPQ